MLTRLVWQHYRDHLKAVLPALGTHAPMRPDQLTRMFGDMPQELFRVHNWRTDVETVGEVRPNSSSSNRRAGSNFRGRRR